MFLKTRHSNPDYPMLTSNTKPLGAVLARDKSTADIRSIASSLIAGKHRSHIESISVQAVVNDLCRAERRLP
jgi:hypothetical protein